MRVILVICLAMCLGGGKSYSLETTSKQSISESSFEKELNQGYDLLKNEPYEKDTVNILKQLHDMEEKIKDEVAQPAEKDSELLNLAIESMSYNKEAVGHMSEELEVGTATHEIGHALGLFHTQSRHDRDNFITVHLENARVRLKALITTNDNM
ncbi:hypothetical protein KIN20_033006 [Parelaphostrongylus tenuis]|uniref:Metalloendopeptidase n=1 Tax=Parelaphostrongylus tenuis TaxID=148309 RepID=A0AAD5WIF7_PARTN|nr:hypothetical protein KIN20_033006 [Parelaphostrongylus tenuis]